MEDTPRKKPSAGDSFSFPSTPTPDSDFEFGSLTPDSPTTEPFTASPADHLFLNGRLQPHSFLVPAAASRTNSCSTRDSLFSSRSNSTNSSCSSARTSSSDSSERKLFHIKVKGGAIRSMANSSHYQTYGCSQRWQYITPVPPLNRDASVRRRDTTKQGKKKKDKGTKRKYDNNNKKKNKSVSKNKKETVNKGVRLRFGRKILRWFVMACRECHAMEPSSKGCNKKM